MPFSIRSYRCFPVHCAVSYNAGLVQGQGSDLESLVYKLETLRRECCGERTKAKQDKQ
jgi:hypothetical protein